MAKRYSTRREMRRKLEGLHDRTSFVAGLDAGMRAATIEAASVVDRPSGAVDLDAGRWLRDPASGETYWVRTGGGK